MSIPLKRVTAWVGRASCGFCCFSSPPHLLTPPEGRPRIRSPSESEAASPTKVPPPSSPGELGPPQSSSLRITAAFSVASVRTAISPSFMSLQGSVWILGDPTKAKAGTGAPWTISESSYNSHWTGEAAKAQTWQVNGRDKSQARGCLSTVFHQLIPTRKKLFQKVHSSRTFPFKKKK